MVGAAKDAAARCSVSDLVDYLRDKLEHADDVAEPMCKCTFVWVETFQGSEKFPRNPFGCPEHDPQVMRQRVVDVSWVEFE